MDTLTTVTQSSSRRLSRRLGRWTAPLLLVAAVTFLAGFLAIEYRPAWYAPRILDPDDLKRARLDAMDLADRISDGLADRKSFEITISEDQLNNWLAGLGDIWPDATRKVPRFLVQPVAALSAGEVTTAARLEYEGWRAIVSTHWRITLADDLKFINLEMHKAQLGALPVPHSIIERILNQFDRPALLGDQKWNGHKIDNRFEWPNGRRTFRITSLRLEPDEIRLGIEPL